jgi:hypothetical protein
MGLKPRPKITGIDGHSDRRVTTCKTCGFGIFHGQPKVWRLQPLVGWVHTDCAPPVEVTSC